MSAELTKARSQISQIRTALKLGKVLAAVQSLAAGVNTVLRSPLLKQEKEEFARMVADAVYALANDKGFLQSIPLKLEYKPGNEKELLAMLKECQAELEHTVVSEAKDQLAELERRQAEALKAGQALLDARRFEEAKRHFDGMVEDYAEDAQLKGEIGERFLAAGRYEEAFDYLSRALEASPDSIHFYNRIGMALRKLGRYDTAEKYYAKALEYAPEDSNLYFNFGRLYIDWCRWDKVMDMADKALLFKPGFVEAQKMRDFARKKLGPPA